MRRLATACTLAAALLLVFPTAAAELAGVPMDDKTGVNGEELVLNGMGLRKKFFIKVYVAGLYLPAKEKDGAEILSADTPRRTVMHFLYDVDKGKICEAWNDSLAANTPKASGELKAQFKQLCDAMQDMAKGQRMTFTYLPGEGTTVNARGETATFKGKAFADALWASWIGDEPATGDLKEGMLGG